MEREETISCNQAILNNLVDNIPNKVSFLFNSTTSLISICKNLEESVEVLKLNGIEESKLQTYQELIQELKPILLQAQTLIQRHKDLNKS